ncbi:hypothetical protein Y032_0198g1615 [Ancylostoma ceylanicum]|uniref:Uncharacterized protein n=1 Tax=Ancylostoma ceylanicum TaxID=53326 RepID=A0A016SP04_9BILA|nr:hypothetical protein Y032_0198g1615 [Ancylostoma ceylanicum]
MAVIHPCSFCCPNGRFPFEFLDCPQRLIVKQHLASTTMVMFAFEISRRNDCEPVARCHWEGDSDPKQMDIQDTSDTNRKIGKAIDHDHPRRLTICCR